MFFYKIRPNFLKNDVTGYNLEIDLYNDEMKLAIEVQGNQHYKFTPFFHRNKDAFLNQKYRDAMKKEKCKNNGITLIEVPYSVGEKKLKSYLQIYNLDNTIYCSSASYFLFYYFK